MVTLNMYGDATVDEILQMVLRIVMDEVKNRISPVLQSALLHKNTETVRSMRSFFIHSDLIHLY